MGIKYLLIAIAIATAIPTEVINNDSDCSMVLKKVDSVNESHENLLIGIDVVVVV